jgi:hypothetical protein
VSIAGAGTVVSVGPWAPGCAVAEGTIRVGLVIDYGLLAGEQGAPAQPRVECVGVADGANGFAVLQGGGHAIRVSNSSGLLCAIDGYPAGNECGERDPDGGYRYWAYFHGGSAWIYSAIGPSYVRSTTGSVEGWHFVKGAGNPNDPAPHATASSASICPAVPQTQPSTQPPPPLPPSPTTTREPGGSPTSRGSDSPTPGAPGSPGGPDSPDGATGGGPGSPTTTSPAVPGDAIAGQTPSGTGDPGTFARGATGPGTSTIDAAQAESASQGAVEVGASLTPARSTPATSPLAIAIVVVAIIGLGGAATMRLRAARRGEDG